MIAYNNNAQLSIVFSIWTGSVVLKAAGWALLSSLLLLAVGVAQQPELIGVSTSPPTGRSAPPHPSTLFEPAFVASDLFAQPYAHYIVSHMLSFLLVFRVQLSYGRYWSGLEHIYESLNRLNCAAGMVSAFDELAVGPAAIRGHAWRCQMMHLFSLLAGTMLLELRYSDAELLELKPLAQLATKQLRGERARLNDTLSTALSTKFVVPPQARPASSAEAALRHPVEVIAGVLDEEKRHLALHAPMYHQAVNSRIVRLLSRRLQIGGLAMPPPIVSRIYQEIALANSGFRQALKIARVRFPFPYAQLLGAVKFFILLITPLVVLSKVERGRDAEHGWAALGWGATHTFFVAFFFTAMTDVAVELEDPFGVDANDLPLCSMHDELNHRLERLLHEPIPKADTAYKRAHLNAHRAAPATPSSSPPSVHPDWYRYSEQRLDLPRPRPVRTREDSSRAAGPGASSPGAPPATPACTHTPSTPLPPYASPHPGAAPGNVAIACAGAAGAGASPAHGAGTPPPTPSTPSPTLNLLFSPMAAGGWGGKWRRKQRTARGAPVARGEASVGGVGSVLRLFFAPRLEKRRYS